MTAQSGSEKEGSGVRTQGVSMKKILHYCDACGKEMYVYKCRLDAAKTVCCSRECSNKVRSPDNVLCAYCGSPFHRKHSYIDKTKHLCCSYECANSLKKTTQSGEASPNYGRRGLSCPTCKEKRTTSCGYIDVYTETHPFRNGDNRVKEHRLVAEQYLLTDENSVDIDGKRYLSPNFVVHHKDNDRSNNDVNNLQVMTKQDHSRLHRLLQLNNSQ